MKTVDVFRGHPLYIEWILPFDDPPGEIVYVDLGYVSLEFQRNGMTIAVYTLSTDEPIIQLQNRPIYLGTQWLIRFEVYTYDWLLEGSTHYEFMALSDRSHAVLVHEIGVVNVHG